MGEKLYSLKELVSEVFEIKEDDITFDANYKKLQRLDSKIRGMSDIALIGQGILGSQKNEVVKFMKEILNNGEAEKILNKVTSNKAVNEEENDILQEILLDNSGDKRESLEKKIKNINETYLRINNVNTKFNNLLVTVAKYFDEEAFFITDLVFSELERKLDTIINKYQEEFETILEETTKRCKKFDELDDMIYKEKMMRVLLAGLGSSKFKHTYQNSISKEKEKVERAQREIDKMSDK